MDEKTRQRAIKETQRELYAANAEVKRLREYLKYLRSLEK